MSPWPREELRVDVGPAHIAVRALRRGAWGFGRRPSTREPEVLTIAAAAGSTRWEPAVDALAGVLSGARKGCRATVVLSNQFVRYLLVPWKPQLKNAAEDLAYARHGFARVYGKGSAGWELRLGQQAPGQPRLASAVDRDLLAALGSTFAQSGVALKSIQPHLMAAFNAARGALPRRGAWFATLEPGHLCLCLLQGGRWSRVIGQRLTRPWRDDLLETLERQSLLGDAAEVPRDVYVASLGGGELELPQSECWRFHAHGAGPARRAQLAAGEGED